MIYSRIFSILFALFSAAAFADDDKPTPEEKKEMEARSRIARGLKYQEGEIRLAGGKAQLKLAPDFRYLDPADTKKVLVNLWGNPPQVAEYTDGMIVTKDIDFDSEDSWAAVIRWKDDGYVKDEEFASINFNDMIKELIEGSKEQSKARIQQGYGKMEIAGWAEPPHYDSSTHKLYWAKSLNVDGPVQGLNYDIRILGRAGVLEVSIIAGMPQLADIRSKTPTILGMLDFTEGNRYADYKHGDKVAAYGIGGLIGAGLLAKAGFFKAIGIFLVKFWKIGVIALVAIGAWIKRLLGRRSEA
jgi:uncharacterized membrane-anchored protein